MRSPSQKLSDCYAITYLLDCVNRVSFIDGNLKVQKLVFLHEFLGIKDKIKSNHYKYFRYNLGPYSKDLANDIGQLENLGILNSSRKLTKRGRFFLEYFRPEVSKSIGQSLEYADAVCDSFGKATGPKLVNQVYKLSVPVSDLGGNYKTVRDIPIFTDIFDPIHDPTTKDLPSLEDETVEQMQEELSISPEELNPSNPDFKKLVSKHLERALA